jgi:hypothetical protein
VDLSKLDLVQPRSVGVEAVALSTLRQRKCSDPLVFVWSDSLLRYMTTAAGKAGAVLPRRRSRSTSAIYGQGK